MSEEVDPKTPEQNPPQVESPEVKAEPAAATGKATTKRWFVVRTYSGQETKTVAYLESQLKDSDFKEKFGEIVIPTENVPTISENGKKKIKTRNFMPGYVMIEVEMDDRVKAFIQSVPSIISFELEQRRSESASL